MRTLAKRPKSYREQDGCHGCKHCFIESDYDAGPVYYCTFRAPPRPRCGSCAMQAERWDRKDGKTLAGRAWSRAFNAWEKWRKGREVQPWGRCEHYEQRPPTWQATLVGSEIVAYLDR